MSIFSKILWQTVKQAKNYFSDGSGSEIEEVRKCIKALEADIEGIYASLKYMLMGCIVVCLISAAGLILGIIAVAR